MRARHSTCKPKLRLRSRKSAPVRGCVKTARNGRLPFSCTGWTGMKRFVEGKDRRQTTLLPDCVDDYVSEENPVRAIEAFVEALDLAALGFEGVVPETTG